jgi:hypothetical protein
MCNPKSYLCDQQHILPIEMMKTKEKKEIESNQNSFPEKKKGSMAN